MTTFTDRELVCRSCSGVFVWTAGAQKFYEEHGLKSEPKRCESCRARRRAEREAMEAR